MGVLINGRTPEEIKLALRCCRSPMGFSCKECPYNGTCLEHEPEIDALALIERLESERDAALAKVPKWISVEEKLPEEAGKYIVCTKKRAVYCTAFRFFHGKGYFATDSTTHLTHWMPLPKEPEEEANETID